jgi:hypothetical protein
MPLRREWNLPIFDGRVRSPLMVNHYPGGRSCQGGVPSERGKLLDGSELQGRLLTRRDGRGRSSASTVGFQPTKNDRAKFRFQLNQHSRTVHCQRPQCRVSGQSHRVSLSPGAGENAS